jgi:hypothetical protein
MDTIVMHRQKFVKSPNTKTTYILEEEITENLTKEQYTNITSDDTLKWFRRLGGIETAQRGYTCSGYLITKLTSKSPDKQLKIIRTFKFN